MPENGRGASPRDLNCKIPDWSARIGIPCSLSRMLAYDAFHEQLLEQLVGLRTDFATGDGSNFNAIVFRRCSGT